MDKDNRISTGIRGLDAILEGGLIACGTYMIRGGPGSGKTTLGLHFLTSEESGKTLFISLGESENKIKNNAARYGFKLDRVDFLDLSPSTDIFEKNQSYTLFYPSEVEKDTITGKIKNVINDLKPKRIYIDSINQLRYLSNDVYKFRQQILSFITFLLKYETTVLFSSECSKNLNDDDLQFLSDGIVNLEFDGLKRTINVLKFRGSGFKKGFHSMKIGENGINVFPRLIPDQVKRKFSSDKISSGIPEIDELLKGGLERGTVSVISGPSGVGKTTLGLQFMKEAAGRGERSVVYSFEEEISLITARSQAINIPISSMIEKGTLLIKNVEPLLYSPDEFAHLVKTDINEENTSIVMIDSISGYSMSIADTDLISHIHALTKFLKNKNITVILINELESIIDKSFKATEVGMSYLMDNIIFLRYIEWQGEIMKTIGVLKKRISDFETRLRKFDITQYGIKVGEPLKHLKNILTGIPELINNGKD